jgi:hypothetical protein
MVAENALTETGVLRAPTGPALQGGFSSAYDADTGTDGPPIPTPIGPPTPTDPPAPEGKYPLEGGGTIVENAEETAAKQGQGYEDLATGEDNRPISDYEGYDYGSSADAIAERARAKDASSYVDNAKSTVAGQLESLLSADSPYIKRQEDKAKEMSASRGMLNSTLAAQAGRTAAIEAALPIAQQDASEYNKFALQQQNTENEQVKSQTEGIISGNLAIQKAQIAETQQKVQNAFSARLAGANEQSKTYFAGMQQQYEAAMSEMTFAQNQFLQNQDISAKVAESIRVQTGAVMQNYQIAVENLLTDPDFLDLGPEALQQNINNLQALATNSIKFIGVSSGLDSAHLDALVSAYFKPLNFTGGTTPGSPITPHPIG